MFLRTWAATGDLGKENDQFNSEINVNTDH